MEAHRQVQLAGRFPQRVPVAIAHEGLPEGLRFAGEQDAAVAHRRAPAYLTHGRLHIPERGGGDGQQSARVRRGPLGLPVVVGLDTGQHELGVLQFEELLVAETGHVGIHDHGPDADLIHVLETGFGVIGAGMHVREGGRPVHHVAPPGGGGQPDDGNPFAVEIPALPAVLVEVHVGDPVPHRGGDPVHPGIGRLGYVGVDIDDGVRTHWFPLQVGACLVPPKLLTNPEA